MIRITGDHNRATRNVLENGKPGGNNSNLPAAVEVVRGSHNRIDHNEVANWHRRGLRVIPTDSTTENRIDHNYLHDFSRIPPDIDSNMGDAFQVGLSGLHSAMKAGTIIEYNLGERLEADGELVSLKSSSNIVRFNTLKDSNASLNIRHGADNQIIGNTLIKMKRLSVYGDNHQIIGNDLQNTPLVIARGGTTETRLHQGKEDGKWKHPAARTRWWRATG